MPPLDFAALMKAERARARGGVAPAADTPPVAPTAEQQRKPTAAAAASSAALSFRLAGSARPTIGPESLVRAAPESVWHVPNWVSEEEEEELLRCADLSPEDRWTVLRGRRLQNLGGLPRPLPEGMAPEALPGWVSSVCDALVRGGVFSAEAPPNHVLLNEYQPGQGIDAHRDGPLYEPRVAILSLGSSCSFDFVRNDETRAPVASLLLPPRGLLVFTADAYDTFLHTVPALPTDAGRPNLVRLDLAPGIAGPDEAAAAAATPPPPRARRVSLTVRRVLHVQSAEQIERLEGRPWEQRSAGEYQAALGLWLGERLAADEGQALG
jgi:alkylated DNA repair protein alkB family protein 6